MAKIKIKIKVWNDKWVSQQYIQLETKLCSRYNYRDCVMADTQTKHNFYSSKVLLDRKNIQIGFANLSRRIRVQSRNIKDTGPMALCVIFMILVLLENVTIYSLVVARLPQRLKSMLFEIFSSLRVPFGHPPFEKISNNIDFSLWGKQCICPAKMRPKL